MCHNRLLAYIQKPLAKSARRFRKTGLASRRFVQFRYHTLKSWSRPQQVIAKAESLVKGDNPKFLVTNLPKQHVGSIHNVYEKLYCARGDMENRIKEQQLCLFADRTSCSQMRTNQLRLLFSSFAYVLMQALQRLGLKGTPFTNAQCSTLHVKLSKIAVRVMSASAGCGYS